MTSRTARRSLCVAAVLSMAAAACGSDEPADRNAEPTDSIPAPATDAAPVEAPVIGTGNVGGEVVDPKPAPIDGIAILESFPEQLAVMFTAGDPNCTAATATARATADSDVVVSLEVGITKDALSRSCVAGTGFEQTITIALDEGLGGRAVAAADV